MVAPTPIVAPVVESKVAEPVLETSPVIADAPFVAKPQAADVAVEEAWYVRPPGGGQFGPATRNDFAQWIRDGRVVPEAFVWRVGWADWRHAREVAGELPAPLPVVAAAVVPSALPLAEPTTALIVVPDRLPMTARPVARRKRSAKRQISLAILLLVVTAILAGVLYWVLTRTPPETDQVATCSMAYDVLG